MPDLRLVTLAERPDLFDPAHLMSQAVWPNFMLQDEVSVPAWHDITGRFPGCQFALLDGARIAVYGNALPLTWDGTPGGLPANGWDGAVLRGVTDHDAGRAPDALCALSITVTRDYRGQGLAAAGIDAMKRVAARAGLRHYLHPLRPLLKSAYPLTPIERYVRWTRADGLPFDPWLRAHISAGGAVLGVEPQSITVTGTVRAWEQWVSMAFPETGAYIVPGALTPVQIDCEQDLGVYHEPHVWLRHAPAVEG